MQTDTTTVNIDGLTMLGVVAFVLALVCNRTQKRPTLLGPKLLKWQPCWCPKPVLWELNSFPMKTLAFVAKIYTTAKQVRENALQAAIKLLGALWYYP